MCQKTLNPFNIRASKSRWLGSHGTYKGFVRFDSFEYGVRAGERLIANYIRKGFTSVYSIINRYAPLSENKTSDYIGYVVASFEHYGLSPYHIVIGSDSYFRLLRCIAIYESGVMLPIEFLTYVFDKWEI